MARSKTQAELFYRGKAVRLQQTWPDGTALVQFLDHGHVAVVSANEVSSVRGPQLLDRAFTMPKFGHDWR